MVLWVSVAALAVALVVLIAILFAGGFGPSKSNANGGGSNLVTSGQTYAQASAAARAGAASYGSGPWNVLFAIGADLSATTLVSTALPSNLFNSGPVNCPGTAEGPTTKIATFAGFDGNLSSGEAPGWLFGLVGAGGTVVMETVLSNQSQVWEKFSGPGCSLLGLLGTVPTTVVDSPLIASTAMADGGTAFAAAHPGGTLTLSVDALTGTGSWSVSYSTCPPNGTAVSGRTYWSYNASLGVTDGLLVGAPSSGPSGCVNAFGLPGAISGGSSFGLPISGALAITNPATEGSGASYTYTVSVTSAAVGLILGDLEFSVLNASGQVPSGPYDVELYAASGCGLGFGALNDPLYIAPFTGACVSGTTGAQAPIAAGETITIASTSSLVGSGDLFVVLGETPYGGNISATIP